MAPLSVRQAVLGVHAVRVAFAFYVRVKINLVSLFGMHRFQSGSRWAFVLAVARFLRAKSWRHCCL